MKRHTTRDPRKLFEHNAIEADRMTHYERHAVHAMDARLMLGDEPGNETFKNAIRYHEFQAARLKPGKLPPEPDPMDDPRVKALIAAANELAETADWVSGTDQVSQQEWQEYLDARSAYFAAREAITAACQSMPQASRATASPAGTYR